MKYLILMFCGPILSAIFISHICFFPDKIITKMPSLIKFFTRENKSIKDSFKDYIPNFLNLKNFGPTKNIKNDQIAEIFLASDKDKKKIWKLSQLEYSLREIENNYANDLKTKKELIDKILQEVRKITGINKINAEILHKFPEYIDKMKTNNILSRIKNFFSFVNFIWIISIFGIIISIIPVIFTIYGLLYPYIASFILFLYEFGIFEMFGYFISILLIADGMKFNKEGGFYVALTGEGLITLFYFNSATKHYDDELGINFKEIFIILGILLLQTYFSLSLAFNSEFFGFLAIILYSLIGFFTGFLDKIFEFMRDSKIYKVIINSFFLMILYIIITSLNINNVEIYRRPIQIFGTLTYFLGLLIISSSSYYDSRFSYIQRQIIFIGSLCLILFLGFSFNILSFINTSFVFGVLYLMLKNSEISLQYLENQWILVFSTSVILWISSLYLHKHPGIIYSIFNGN